MRWRSRRSGARRCSGQLDRLDSSTCARRAPAKTGRARSVSAATTARSGQGTSGAAGHRGTRVNSATNCRSSTRAHNSTISISTRWHATSATTPSTDLRTLPDLERALQRAGLPRQGPRRAVAAFAQGDAAARRTGAARRRGPVVGAFRGTRHPQGRFDGRADRREPGLAVRRHRTVGRDENGHQRGAARAPGRVPVRLQVVDVEVTETEQRAQAAVALLVDTSFSMVMEGRWVPMKRTALALITLSPLAFGVTHLQLIGFGRYAQHAQRRRTRRPRRRLRTGHQPAPRADAGRAGTCGGTPTRSRWC